MSMTNDIEKVVHWIKECFKSDNIDLDETIESFKLIDKFFDENTQNGLPLPGSPLNESLGAIIFALGSYVGTSIIKKTGGKWNALGKTEITVEIELVDGTRMWPVRRVMDRFKHGKESSIYDYGIAAIDNNQIGLISKSDTLHNKGVKRWWKFW